MSRKTKVIAVSIPPDIAKEYDRLAKRERTNRSELFRRMFESYRIERDLVEFHSIQRDLSKHINRGRKKPYTEAEIERLIADD